MAAAKRRLDQLLVDRGLAESRTKAQALILAGLVFTGEQRLASAGAQVSGEIPLALRGQDHSWVSRGGLKLARGLTHFGFEASGCVALDIGASTGGFSDVLLHNGAAKVYAVDVGYGQLAHKIRIDPRVIVLERTNARHLTAGQVSEPATAIVCDASFIGLRTVLPAALALAAPRAWLIALIKPQFEVGRDDIGSGGIVRNAAARERAVAAVRDWLAQQPGWTVTGMIPSPIVGGGGNLEFLIGARRNE